MGSISLSAFARQIGMSPSNLSQLERGYIHPKRGLVVPSDDMLEKLAVGLDIPLSRLHALLGRLPDQPYQVFENPDAVQLAERFVRLPDYAKPALWDALQSLEALVERRESQETQNH